MLFIHSTEKNFMENFLHNSEHDKSLYLESLFVQQKFVSVNLPHCFLYHYWCQGRIEIYLTHLYSHNLVWWTPSVAAMEITRTIWQLFSICKFIAHLSAELRTNRKARYFLLSLTKFFFKLPKYHAFGFSFHWHFSFFFPSTAT